MDRWFLHANSGSVCLGPLTLDQPAPKVKAPLAEAIWRSVEDIYEITGPIILPWLDLLLEVRRRIPAARAMYVGRVLRRETAPAQAIVSSVSVTQPCRGLYRLADAGEVGFSDGPPTCRTEILGAIAILNGRGRRYFRWTDVWEVMQAGGTRYTRQTVRVTIASHMLEKPLNARTRNYGDLRRVSHGVYELLNGPQADPSTSASWYVR